MKATGGCYCGAVRYEVDGDALFKGQCHCRECQYFSGGQPNMVMGIPAEAFKLVKGEVKPFSRTDIDNAATREFCTSCGTSMWTKSPAMPGAYLIKVGTLDDMKVFGGPDMAIFTCDAESWHPRPENVPSFDKVPG